MSTVRQRLASTRPELPDVKDAFVDHLDRMSTPQCPPQDRADDSLRRWEATRASWLTPFAKIDPSSRPTSPAVQKLSDALEGSKEEARAAADHLMVSLTAGRRLKQSVPLPLMVRRSSLSLWHSRPDGLCLGQSAVYSLAERWHDTARPRAEQGSRRSGSAAQLVGQPSTRTPFPSLALEVAFTTSCTVSED